MKVFYSNWLSWKSSFMPLLELVKIFQVEPPPKFTKITLEKCHMWSALYLTSCFCFQIFFHRFGQLAAHNGPYWTLFPGEVLLRSQRKGFGGLSPTPADGSSTPGPVWGGAEIRKIHESFPRGKNESRNCGCFMMGFVYIFLRNGTSPNL